MFDAFKEFVQQTEARVEAVARRAERSDALRADGPSEAEVLWFFYKKNVWLIFGKLLEAHSRLHRRQTLQVNNY